NSDANDVYLNGKLSVIAGDVIVGNSGNNRNNDIEYSGGGDSEIEIQGGSLTVNGQIRRNPSTTAGVLKYAQSGGALTVNGRNANTTNAKFEVLNTGSNFDMSAGTINIVRGGGGSTYGDLYLRAETSSVTGGEIIFSQTGITSTEDYILDATIPLNDLTITGNNGRDATVTLLISPLTVNGDLTLSNANSILDANTSFDIDVTINGDFTNSGTYNHYSNQTIFNGGAQNILGTTVNTFYDLNVNPITSLTLNNNITVQNDLDLSSGTLICGSNTVYVSGNVDNNATYTDVNSGIVLNGSSQQYLSGTGTFGQLELNNSSGARLSNGITLQKDLVLTQGILDINKYLLILGVNSNIQGAPFSDSKMITSDGVYSNVGIQKYFPTGPSIFTFPIGTSGKYTPADLTITANTNVGYIRLNNINSRHPGVIDPTNVLSYFWEVESFGILGMSGSLVFNYLDDDVVGGPESSYISARLIVPGTSWSKTTNVDDVANTLTYTYTTTDNLSGDYTAGLDPAFPNDVPEYTSNANGNWTNQSIWTQTGGSTYPCPPGGPNGFIVNIDHEVTANADYCLSYQTTINDRLILPAAYSGHNLGTVSGNGTLYMEKGILPEGKYASFFDCSGNGTLEYGGSGSYSLVADLYSSLPNLLFSGTGTRILPNSDLTICNLLEIDGPTLDNSVNNKKLTIQGSFERYNTGAFLSGSGTGATVSFEGSALQTLGGATGDFIGSNAFNNLEINNSSGLNIGAAGSIEVTGNLMLTDGIIQTTSTEVLTITNTDENCVIPSGGSSSSYINGPLIKRINQGDEFFFPIGKDVNPGNKLTLKSVQSGTLDWVVEYFNPNTNTTFSAPLTSVNLEEYWQVSGVPAASRAKVNIAWDPLSDLTPLMTQNGLTDMRVAEYNGSNWVEIASSSMGNNYNGTVETNNRVTLSTGTREFTIACVNQPIPRARLAPTGPVCGTDGIPVTFTSSFPIELNYTLSYNKDGVPQTPVTISSLPYTLPTDAAGGDYTLTAFTYNNPPSAGPAVSGVVDASTVSVFATPTTAAAGTDQSLCGGTSATLAANTPTVGTGLWSIINGTGGTVVSPTVPTSDFNGTNGTSYTLRWTISNGTCESTDDVVINFPILPGQPSAFTTSSSIVCQNDAGVAYAITNDPLVSYNWSYSGSDVTINGTTNSVTLDFGSSATGGNLSVEAVNGCGTSAPRTMGITVTAQPTISLGTDPEVCEGVGSANLTYSATTGGANQYSIDYDATAEAEGFSDVNLDVLPVSPIVLAVPGTASPGTYDATLTVTNSVSSCTSQDYAIQITINTRPVITFVTEVTNVCEGSMGNVYSTQPGMSNYVWDVPTGGSIEAGGTGSDDNVTVTWSSAGARTVSVNYDDGNGCNTASPVLSNV
ncbi:MAG: hypothetical protein MI922_08815, partial [Bacteroidales bacterium]|nr:hypothetical protein [Bacteroidales bacterium]